MNKTNFDQVRVRFPRDGGTAGTRPGVKWYAARKRLGTTGLKESINIALYARIKVYTTSSSNNALLRKLLGEQMRDA